MRDLGWGLVAVVGSCVWGCSSDVTQVDVTPGGAAGMTENAQAGAMQGGATNGGEAGARAAFADAGASGEGGGGAAGAGADGGSGGAVDPGHFWDCLQGSAGEYGADPSLVSSDEPSSLPSGDEATLEQLAGDWLHDSTVDYNGNLDYFQFNADGTGSQDTVTNYWEVTWSTTYVGTFVLADHVIMLDSTAGRQDGYDPSPFGPQHPPDTRHEDLPRQTLRFGYSYDAASDTLFVNNVVCTEPVPFRRVKRP